MQVIPASRWSADPDLYARMQGEDQGRIEWRVGHWPGGRHVFAGDLNESIRKLRDYETYHLSRGWRGLAYDHAIDLAGRFFEIRMTGMSAATSGDYDEDGVPNNRVTDACLFLLGPGQKPSRQMLDSAVELDRSAPDLSGRWLGHDEASGPGYTDCPGTAVMEDIVVPMRQGRMQAAGPVRPAPTPEDTMTPEQEKRILDAIDAAARNTWTFPLPHARSDSKRPAWSYLARAIAGQTVDVQALAEALADELPEGYDPDAVAQRVAARFAALLSDG